MSEEGNRVILNGGAFEGADRFIRETAMWRPSMRSPDAVINGSKVIADARGRDTVRNSGHAYGAVAIHKDSIVGAQYRLNARPNIAFLGSLNPGFDEVWADEFQSRVEAYFTLLGESDACWLDAQRVNTFTGMIRLGVGVFLMTGESLATAEWVRETDRPLRTAYQRVSSDRLCNPQNAADSKYLRRGITRDDRGKALSYWFRMGEPTDGYYNTDNPFTWNNVPTTKPWGRKQVVHIVEQNLPDQSRGVSDMVAALKNMHMTKKFQDVVLQNAVINASYAAAIESELPNDAISAALGTGNPEASLMGVYRTYMTALGSYLDDANNIRVDGAQIPHLFPGTKLHMQPVKDTGGVGTGFEESLQRHTAASLGLSYEEFSRDFSKTNYSSGRAAMGVSGRFMAARKKHVADREANEIYSLVLEEMMSNDNVPLPFGVKRDVFYTPLAKEAFTQCSWVGSGIGQIDELKETQAALLRISGGLSTYENEISRLGGDWRENFAQRGRETAEMDRRGLVFDLSATRPLGHDPSPGDTTTTDQTAGAQVAT